jgi:hypothetical protein
MDRLHQWIVCLGLLTLGVGAWTLTASQEGGAGGQNIPDYTAAEMKAIALRSDRLQKLAAAQRDFEATLLAVVGRLIEHPDLRRATAEVHEAARTSHPRFLTFIGRVEPGVTDREKVAYSLIKHLQCGIRLKEFPPETVAIVEQLQEEAFSPGFLHWCANEEKAGGVTQAP